MTPRFVSLILVLTMFCSCHRIRHKISETKNAVVNKIIPGEDKKKLFADRFKDIKADSVNIYTDYMGVDYKEMFNFTCSPADMQKIVADNHMELAPNPEEGLYFGEDFSWWDKEKMRKIHPYTHGKDNEDRQYLWYDPATHQAWYIIFSL